jgi:hypothetical protein
MTVHQLHTPPADDELERLWEDFRESQEVAQAADATFEQGLEAGRRWKAFIYACVEHEGEL